MKSILSILVALTLVNAEVSAFGSTSVSMQETPLTASIEGNELSVHSKLSWSIRIYDMRGRLLLERNGLSAKGIFLQDLEKGRYLVKIESDKQSQTLFYQPK